MVGWVKRNVGTIYVGFAYLNAPQKFGVEVKLANPTRLVADRRLNPTYDLAFRPTKWVPSFLNLSGSEPNQNPQPHDRLQDSAGSPGF